MAEGLSLDELENLPEPVVAKPASKGLSLDELDAIPDVISDKVTSSPMSSDELAQFYKENPDLREEILKYAPSVPSVQSAEANQDPNALDYMKALVSGFGEGAQDFYGVVRKGMAYGTAPIIAAWNKSTGPQGYIGNQRNYDSLVTDAYDRGVKSEGVPGVIADPINLVSMGVGGVGERLALRALPEVSGLTRIAGRGALGAGENAAYVAASNALDRNRESNLSDVGYGALLGGFTGMGQGILTGEASRVAKIKESNLAERAKYADKMSEWEDALHRNENRADLRRNADLYAEYWMPKHTFKGKEYTDFTRIKEAMAKRPEYSKHGLDPESITDKEAIDFVNSVNNPVDEVVTTPILKEKSMLPEKKYLAGPTIGGLLGFHFGGGNPLAITVGSALGLGTQFAGRKFAPLANRAYGASVPTIVKIADPTIGALRYPGTRGLFELKESLQNPPQSAE